MISRTGSRHATHNRTAFTLPELLVVVTVTLVLMGILVQASTIITNTVSEAKAQGDFVGQERTAIAVIRRDLQCDHFFADDSNTGPSKGRKLSDQRSDRAALSTDSKSIVGYKPPRSGYFWASAPGVDSANNFDEGTDAGGFSSSRSGNHFVQFTITVPGGSPDNTLTADIPFQNQNLTTGTCAEIAYYLVLNGQTTNNTKYYKLIRRQRLVGRNTDDAPAYASRLNTSGAPSTDPPEVVAATGSAPNFKVFNMNEMTLSSNRLGVVANAPRQPISTHRIGEDVLHNYVTSFELKFTGTSGGGTQWPRPFTQNTDFPYDSLPFDGSYDTCDQGMVGTASNLATSTNTTGRLKPIRITGVQIKLRCWNPTNRSTRQTTTAVDL